jgi:hypothetical protein
MSNNGWIGKHVVVSYIGKDRLTPETFSGIVEKCRFIDAEYDYLYTVKLDGGGYRSLYLDNTERAELLKFDGQDPYQ